MKRWVWLTLCVVVFAGCGKNLRPEEVGDVCLHVNGNLLVSTSSGKQQLQVEMYGREGEFWMIEGRDSLVSGRIFWLLSTVGGTNYLHLDIQKLDWYYVDEEFSHLFVKVLPLFFEKQKEPVEGKNGVVWENGWAMSWQREGLSLVVRKRFDDGRPRLMVIEKKGKKIYLDLLKIDLRRYHIPDYEDVQWEEVRFASDESVWEVMGE